MESHKRKTFLIEHRHNETVSAADLEAVPYL